MNVDIINTCWDTDRFLRETCFQKGIVPISQMHAGSATGGGQGGHVPRNKNVRGIYE